MQKRQYEVIQLWLSMWFQQCSLSHKNLFVNNDTFQRSRVQKQVVDLCYKLYTNAQNETSINLVSDFY